MSSASTAIVPLAVALPPSRTHLEFLPAALEVLETPASPAGRAVAATIGLFLISALAWSIIGHVDIVATAPGTIIPAGKSKIVQPLEAGVIRAILVQDGDHVRAGQTLFELDNTVAAAERDRILPQLHHARLDAAGLRALRHDLDTGEGLHSFVPPDGASPIELEQTRAGIAARRAEQMAKLANLIQQIAGKQAEQAENTATIEKLAASLPWLEQKLTLRRQLLSIEFGNRLAYLDAEQAMVEGRTALTVQQKHAPEITAALNALTAQHEQAVASYAHDVLKDLADAEEKAGTLDQQLREAAHKAEQTVLTAPVDGTVQQLAVHTLGGVVTPAQALLTVVPDDAGMLVEAHIQNKDVGFVHAGQDVEVKVQAFEFTRYGLIHGTVLDVSRDAVAANADPAKARDANRGGAQSGDDDGQSDAGGYVAHVALRSTTVQTEDGMAALGPGMSVTAEVKTGRRRVIGYLLSPLQRYAHEGARER